MGVRNFLIDGGSGTGKTSVCRELRRRGFHAVNGDRDLAYWGDPGTGAPIDGALLDPFTGHRHWLWDISRVQELVADRAEPVTFLCGGSRNHADFIGLLDGVFVLEADLDTVMARIDERVAVDPSDWGGRPAEREQIIRLHRTREGIPEAGTRIDATAPLERVVDDILARVDRLTRPPAPPSRGTA